VLAVVIRMRRRAPARPVEPYRGAEARAEEFQRLDGSRQDRAARVRGSDLDVLGPDRDVDVRAGREARRVAGDLDASRVAATIARDARAQEVHRADELRHEARAWRRIDLLGPAHLLDGAVVHDDDPVGHGERLLLVVRDQDRGDAKAALQRADLPAQVQAHARVERGKRFVEQEQRGRGRQRARERDALLLPARELRRVLAARPLQPDQREQRLDPRDARGSGGPGVGEPVADVLRDGEVREQGVGLEHDAEVALRGGQARDVAPALVDAPGVLPLEARDHAQQRGLPASGRAEEADELARPDVEVDAVERGEGAEALHHALYADSGIHRGGTRVSAAATSRRSGGSTPPARGRGWPPSRRCRRPPSAPRRSAGSSVAPPGRRSGPRCPRSAR
jgi:hypothetical protein